jgi:hypothetical protein
MHSYLRFKHALLEDKPTIKAYDEVKWASLPDASNSEIEYSVELLTALHRRWVVFLKDISPNDFNRTYFHPEQNRKYSLDISLLLYAWHGKHHLHHI